MDTSLQELSGILASAADGDVSKSVREWLDKQGTASQGTTIPPTLPKPKQTRKSNKGQTLSVCLFFFLFGNKCIVFLF